jgi:hypothetical protein
MGFDQLSQTSGVVIAIISSPRGARAPIDAERRGREVRALGIGVGVSTLDATELVSKGNLIDGREESSLPSIKFPLVFDAVSIDFSEAWPSTSSVAADEAQLTRNPFLEGPAERLDFLSIGLWRFDGVLRVELDFRSFLLSRIGGGVNF